MTKLINRNEETLIIPPPVRGLNSYDPPHRMPEAQGVEAYNVEIDEVLGIEKRAGFTAFNSASAMIPRYNAGSIREITGAMIYGSGVTWTASVCKASDVFFIPGNSSAIFWAIASQVGTATISLAVAYSQTVTAGSYILGPKEVGNLFNYKYGTTQKMVAFAGSDGFAATPGTTGSFAAISAALTDYQNVSAVTFQDNLYFCNGYQFKYYNGSSVSAASGSPDPADPLYLAVYTIGNANWLWIGGSQTDADKSQFAFCDINAPGTWPAANIYYAGDRDGGILTGGASIPGGFVIYKDNGIFVFTGIPGSGTLRKVVSDIGLVAPRTLKTDKGVHYFVGRRAGKIGVYRFDGTPNIVCCSKPIEVSLNALSVGNVSKFTAEIYNNKYILGTRTAAGTWNNEHYVCYIDRPFDYLNQFYFPWVRGDRKYQSLLTLESAGTPYFYSGSPVGGFVYLENTGNTNDTTENLSGEAQAINAYVDTAWLNFGDNTHFKELKEIYIDLTESGDWELNFSISKDFDPYGLDTYEINLGSTVMIWSDVQYGVTSWQTAVDKNVHEIRVRYPCSAKYFKFRWSNADANEYFSVYPMTCYFKRENR